MKAVLVVFLSVAILFVLSCEEEKVDQIIKVEEDGLNKLRIRNETPYLFDNVYVKIGEDENNYSSVKPNETSAYMSFSRTSYPFIKVSMQGQETEFQIHPIETPPIEVDKGNTATTPLTLVININEQTNGLDLYFIE